MGEGVEANRGDGGWGEEEEHQREGGEWEGCPGGGRVPQAAAPGAPSPCTQRVGLINAAVSCKDPQSARDLFYTLR